MDKELIALVWAKGGDIAAVIVCMWAFLRGGPVERYGAAIISVAWTLSFFLTSHAGNGPGVAVITIDIVALFLFAVLAIWSRRMWTFFATGAILNAVVAHLVRALTKFAVFGYVTTTGFWTGWIVLICLAFGILGYRRSLGPK